MLGFSTISIFNYPDIEWNKILPCFEYFDVTPSSIDLIPQNKILSLQGIFYSKNLTNSSLVRTQNEFNNLKNIFVEILQFTKNNGVHSIIWGAPITRTGMEVSYETAVKRAVDLILLAQNEKVKLYFEALPNSECQFLNLHSELIELHKLAGIGGIHYDICTGMIQNEGSSFVKANLSLIERFHLSIEGYGLEVLNNHTALSIYQKLHSKNIVGTLEVQDFNNITTTQLLKKVRVIVRKSRLKQN